MTTAIQTAVSTPALRTHSRAHDSQGELRRRVVAAGPYLVGLRLVGLQLVGRRPGPRHGQAVRAWQRSVLAVALLLGSTFAPRSGAMDAAARTHAAPGRGAAAATAPKPADLEAVDARIAATRNWISKARSSEAATTKALREAETELGDARQQLTALNSQARSLAAQERELLQRVADLDAERAQITLQAAAHLRVLQRIGAGDPARLLFTLEDPTDMPRVMTYYGYLQRARQRVLQSLAQNSGILRAAQRSLVAQRLAIAAQQRAVQTETARIQQLHVNRASALVALQGDIGARDAELTRLRAERAELQSLLASLARPRTGVPSVLPPGTLFGQAKGRLPWPVAGRVSARFGAPKESTTLKWEGLLIDAPEGTEVDAVHQGQVAFTGWMRGLGTILILDHGNGFMSLYAHLNTVSHQAGDKISAGAPIGAVGTSGGRTDPALYFEIRQRGSPVDPDAWLSKR